MRNRSAIPFNFYSLIYGRLHTIKPRGTRVANPEPGMKTSLLLFGTLLNPAMACESHDFLVQTVLAHAHHRHVIAAQTSKTAAPGKQSPPPPAKPAPQPTEKSPPAKPTPPPHLFM